MNRSMLGRIAITSLALGLATVACTPHAGMSPQAASAKAPKAERMAAKQAAKARDALSHNKALAAVSAAEDAVALMPQDAGYRMLLGQAYLASGRFASAETSFQDSLTLSSDQPKATFDLALAEVAQGKGDAAQGRLKTLSGSIPAADLGLAITLAGDHQGGIAMLIDAARKQDATARTRQNLALAYALDGHWREARAVAMQDTPPDRLNDQLSGWAAMAGPNGGARQVAAMLGVSPVADPGLPSKLALNVPAAGAPPVALASADAAPASDVTPVSLASADAAPLPASAEESALPVAPAPAVAVAAPEAAPVAPVAAPVRMAADTASAPVTPAMLAAEPAPAPATPVMLASAPARQSAPLLRAPKSPVRKAVFTPVAAGNGEFAVQLGAFARAGAIETAWGQASRKAPALSAYSPAQARFQLAGASLSRLSITGFKSREDAAKLCGAVKARGGDCFVRAIAGDAPLEWVHRDTGTQVASR